MEKFKGEFNRPEETHKEKPLFSDVASVQSEGSMIHTGLADAITNYRFERDSNPASLQTHEAGVRMVAAGAIKFTSRAL